MKKDSGEKNTFLLYKDWKPLIDACTAEQAGDILKGIYAYVCEGDAPEFDNPLLSGFFEMIRHWASEPGRAVITVTHDLTLARRYGTHGLLMREGRCAASGRIEAALAAERLREVYGMDIAGWMQEALALWK